MRSLGVRFFSLFGLKWGIDFDHFGLKKGNAGLELGHGFHESIGVGRPTQLSLACLRFSSRSIEQFSFLYKFVVGQHDVLEDLHGLK